MKKLVPYLGVVAVPFHDFPKHFSDFCFHSFYTKSQAIVALGRVRAECRALSHWAIFNTDIPKVQTVTEGRGEGKEEKGLAEDGFNVFSGWVLVVGCYILLLPPSISPFTPSSSSAQSVTLSYFEQHQINSVTACHVFLKEKWIANLKAAIRQSLNAVGKGWFNLAEKSREVYMFSKLKRV